MSARFFLCTSGLLAHNNVGCLRTLRTLLDLEFDLLAFFKIPEAVSLDGRIVNEDVLAALAGDEAVAFATIEPLDRAGDAI
jgi:hypothetical protein